MDNLEDLAEEVFWKTLGDFRQKLNKALELNHKDLIEAENI